jgi:phosphoribosylformylglycinamidine (FGAM) synthase PurS component
MPNIVMLVGLKIPDGTALSARQALKEMGFKELKDLSRYLYYSFEVTGNEDAFKKKIANADLLVNANKHTVLFEVPKKGVSVIVQDREKPTGLMNTLKERLGLSEIKSMEAGTLWVLDVTGKNPKDSAKRMAEELLVNVHFQDYTLR